jgi:hypothetical protein
MSSSSASLFLLSCPGVCIGHPPTNPLPMNHLTSTRIPLSMRRSAENGIIAQDRLVAPARSFLHFIQLCRGGFHKRLEQRVRPIGPALEFGMELRANHEGMIGQLGDFHQASIG